MGKQQATTDEQKYWNVVQRIGFFRETRHRISLSGQKAIIQDIQATIDAIECRYVRATAQLKLDEVG